MDLPDEELVRRIQAGDEDAFPVLFDRHLETLRSYARRWLPARLRRRVARADVIQEVRITALGRFADFEHRGPDSVRNWLLRVLELKVRDAVERHAAAAKRSVGREVTRGLRPETAQFVGNAPTPIQVAVASELEAHAREALLSLPEDHQEVLRLSLHEGLSLRETALRLERSYEATKKLYTRALARMGHALRKLRGETRG